MDSKEAKKRASEITEDLRGFAGQLPIERVIRKHQDFFHELRNTGATWGQIAKLMAAVGFRRADGSPLTERHWSAMYSRIRQPAAPNVEQNADPASPLTQTGNFSFSQRHNVRSSLREKMNRAAKVRKT